MIFLKIIDSIWRVYHPIGDHWGRLGPATTMCWVRVVSVVVFPVAGGCGLSQFICSPIWWFFSHPHVRAWPLSLFHISLFHLVLRYVCRWACSHLCQSVSSVPLCVCVAILGGGIFTDGLGFILSGTFVFQGLKGAMWIKLDLTWFSLNPSR